MDNSLTPGSHYNGVSATDQPQQGSEVHNWWSHELSKQTEAVTGSIDIWQGSHLRIVHRFDSIAKCDQSPCSSQDQLASLMTDGDTESLEIKSSIQTDSSTDSCSSDVNEAHDAIASIEAAMTPVPQGAYLWHGTLHKNWAYSPHQWLATSMTVGGALHAKNYDHDTRFIVLRVCSRILGLPCAKDSFFKKEWEVLLQTKLSVQRVEVGKVHFGSRQYPFVLCDLSAAA